MTQNVVIDVFDELIIHLHKGHGDSGCESLKCTVGGLVTMLKFIFTSRHHKWQIVPLIDVENDKAE